MQFKKQQLELDMEQQAGSKSGKEYVNAVYWHPAYLTLNLHNFMWLVATIMNSAALQ